MNPIFSKILNFFISVILPIIVGYLIKIIFKIKKEKLDFLLFVNIFIFLPISMSLVFWNMKLDKSMILLPVLGFITPLISGGFGYIFCKGKYDDPKQKGAYIISNLLNNRGTIGGLTMYILFGEIGYAYVNLIILFAGIYIYFIAYPLGYFYGNSDKLENASIKSVIFRKTNLPIAGIIVGILLNIFAGDRPDVIAQFIDPMVKTIAWLALVPIGASIDFHGVKKHLRKVLDTGLIRFVMMPCITALIAYPLIPDTKMATSLVLINIMPSAINSVIISKIAKLDENVSIAIFLYTTAVYLFVVFPILTIIFS